MGVQGKFAQGLVKGKYRRGKGEEDLFDVSMFFTGCRDMKK